MKKKYILHYLWRTIFCFALVAAVQKNSFAQFPVCDSMVYFIYNGAIYNLNTYLPISATNPVPNTFPPPGGISLAVSPNLNSATGPSPTFYAVVGVNYYYYDGTAWVNTGHTSGSVDIGGGGGFIYGKTGNQIYRYDGTGNATMITTIPSAVNVFDIAADCEGNFYVLDLGGSAFLRKYSPSGTLLYEWTVLGGPGSAICFSLSGNQLLVGSNPVYAGTVDPTSATVNLTSLGNIPSAIDFGGCPFTGAPIAADTLYSCKAGDTVKVRASGGEPYSHLVLNGSATITGTGPEFSIVPDGFTTLVLYSSTPACGSGGNAIDTFWMVPPAVVDAGPDDTLYGCGKYTGTIAGSLTGTSPWVDYTISWTPAGIISSGGTTVHPVINPVADTTFRITVTTGPAQGGCTFTDSVRIKVKDESILPDYTYVIDRGCNGDSVAFVNTSVRSTRSYWDFGDGATDTITAPRHFYPSQGSYQVKLIASNYLCKDSAIKVVDTRHPLQAVFTASRDTICQDGVVNFSNSSTVTLQPASYSWDFGDGGTSTLMNPTHQYTVAGTYQVRMVAKDTLPCYDTAYRTIVVDSTPHLELVPDYYDICTGQSIQVTAHYTGSGNTGLDWDFGDNSPASDINPAGHAYALPGTYHYTLKARYRVCEELTAGDSVNVHPLPVVNLGPDTTICLDAAPFYLTNLEPVAPGEHYRWSTGDTARVLRIAHHGSYSLTVTTPYDCNATDVVVIDKDCYIDVPNSFTPNNDGNNDYFFPRQLLSKNVGGFTMKVFNRWGQVVFETSNRNGRGWDGRFNDKEQPSGVYIYQINVVLANGRTEQYSGNVTLLR
ncbi:PKD domain-containing protein [Taibaiella helva]|uniref:PKD domain-containing protein n=1 Tax=Taibaiella helva TaxID=2301235 RepID=UPI001300A4A8|nr:PKD domain-containing protein [Taibaiella helva]